MNMAVTTPLPTLFYFAHVRELRNFRDFAVERSFPVVNGKATTSYDVVGTEIRTGQRHVLAELHAQGPAETFRDMAEICSRA